MGPREPGVNINGDGNIDNDSIDGGINDLNNGDGNNGNDGNDGNDCNDGNDDELGGVPGARVYYSK